MSIPNDSRKKPQIELQTIFLSLFICFILRIKSFNLLESQYTKNGRLEKFTGKSAAYSPSANTLDYSLCRFDIDRLFEINMREVVNKARKNKIYQKGTIDGFVVVGLDGSELYNSYSEWPDWSKRQITIKDEEGNEKEVDQYYVRAVFAEYVGENIKLHLGAVRQKKGEFEVDAAIRLIKKLDELGNHYCDVIVSDALYI